ncbi:MAG: hypothetical protein HRU20_11745 [Pseudomonadales bacterium]|nr:hypothetical protein [Pseudomonadales bacterium]
MKSAIKTHCFTSFLLLASCSNVEEHPQPSTEAAAVLLTKEPGLLKNCKLQGAVIGYGTFDDEVKNDLRHQAAVKYQADTVLLATIKTYYQTQRLENYLRTPTMKAPKATNQYYYEDAFTLKAKGTAYRCNKTASL